MDFDNDFEYYVLHFRYKHLHFKHGFNTWQGFHIFKSKNELMSYVNLEEGSLLDAVYNDDNILRRSNNEILLYAEDTHGRSVWESDLLRVFAEIKDFFYREFGDQDTSYDVLLTTTNKLQCNIEEEEEDDENTRLWSKGTKLLYCSRVFWKVSCGD